MTRTKYREGVNVRCFSQMFESQAHLSFGNIEFFCNLQKWLAPIRAPRANDTLVDRIDYTRTHASLGDHLVATAKCAS